jgi:ribosomal protein S27AE
MKLMKVCPSCGESFLDKELVVTKPTLKIQPRWYEASHHMNGRTSCPLCGAGLAIKKASLWPLLLLVPAGGAPFFLPSAYSTWVLVAFALGSILLLKVTISYEKNDR